MSGNNDWMDQHFNGTGPKRIAPPVPESGGGSGWTITLLFVAALGGGVVAADYFQWIELGIFVRPANPYVAAPAPVMPTPEQPERPRPMPVAFKPEPQPAPSAPAKELIDPARLSQLRARIAQLDRGLDLMGRELQEAQSAAQSCIWEITVRRNKARPYSAAERIELTQEYARNHPNLSAVALQNLKVEHDGAVADFTNAKRRLKELNEKAESLTGRMTKADAERAAAVQEISAP